MCIRDSVHPSLVGGPELVHVDAYRLGGSAELDDLDLDSELDEAVTVVEWGAGLAEGLADERLEITLVADPATEARTLTATGVGARWAGVDVESHLQEAVDATTRTSADEGGVP